ncbi:hypothetical protein NODU109028_06545 [Nocardioides dubius]|uniref:Uncharacterized protein n=1 Tax=Nocardioides dubius TaxID=317019 RepID=A0ABP4EAB6_9ACTN
MTQSPAKRHPWTFLPGTSPADAVYGAIVSAATIGAVGLHVETIGRLCAVWAFVVWTYWMAHVYVHVVSHHLAGQMSSVGRRLRDALRGEFGVVLGALPGLVVVLLVGLFDGEPATAASTTLLVTVVLLFGLGYFGARRLGAGLALAVGEGLLASSLGVVMIAAKALLH